MVVARNSKNETAISHGKKRLLAANPHASRASSSFTYGFAQDGNLLVAALELV